MKNNFLISLAFFLLLSSVVSSKPIVRVEGASFRPLQIALPDFSSSAEGEAKTIAVSLTSHIKQYLEFTGVFKVLDAKSYLADIKKESLDVKSIQMKQWGDIGAEGLVKGVVSFSKGRFSVEVGIYQVGIQKDSEQRKYMVIPKDIRKLSLKISDDIYRYFTGEAGPFMSQIAAIKMTPSGKQLIVMDIDGQNERQITKNSGLNLIPVFTPEGNAILFTSYLHKNPDLYSIGIDGANLRKISSYPGLNVGVSFSPNNNGMAITLSKDNDSEIYLMDRSGKNLQRLTNSYGPDISPSFSPDGKQIAFVSSRSGNPHIYIMNADGTNPRRLTFQGKYNQVPRFSPRGDYIVFTARDERNVFDIFLFDLKTNKISRITQDQGNNEDATFVPGGRMVVFTSTRNKSRDLYISNLDGTFQRRITHNGQYWTPSVGLLP